MQRLRWLIPSMDLLILCMCLEGQEHDCPGARIMWEISGKKRFKINIRT